MRRRQAWFACAARKSVHRALRSRLADTTCAIYTAMRRRRTDGTTPCFRTSHDARAGTLQGELCLQEPKNGARLRRGYVERGVDATVGTVNFPGHGEPAAFERRLRIVVLFVLASSSRLLLKRNSEDVKRSFRSGMQFMMHLYRERLVPLRHRCASCWYARAMDPGHRRRPVHKPGDIAGEPQPAAGAGRARPHLYESKIINEYIDERPAPQ